jgi:hypothetical protein
LSGLETAGLRLLENIPAIAAWCTGMVLAVIMVRRGGGKTEKLLLAGCCLMLIIELSQPFLIELVRQLSEGRFSATMYQAVISIPLSILGLAGFVCLIIAFWMRFRRKKQEL